jgi:phosphate transport system protein
MNGDGMPRPRRQLDAELDALQARLLEMAGIVEESVLLATRSALRRDPQVADVVRGKDDRVDELEVEIDEHVLELLALQQPLAKDLRQIMSTLKVTNDLERVGDHALNIAKAARRLSAMSPLPELPEIEEMVDVVRGMLSDALAGFISGNSGTARMVCIRDDRVDNLRRSLFRIMVTHMLEDPRMISPALEVLLISQNLERIADLCTNVAEDTVFLVEGRTIKHGAEQWPSGDRGGA